MIATRPVERVLEKLDGVRRSGDGWQAKCPAHDDRHASLCIGEGTDGRALLKCQAGCTFNAIVAAAGLQVTDLFTRPTDLKSQQRLGPVIDRYVYFDTDGTALFEIHRFAPKTFRAKLPGATTYGELNGTKRVPYRLLELSMSDPERGVFIPEGEKDVNRLMEYGLIATCNPFGAGQGKWLDAYSDHLVARSVYILPDNDRAGRDHAEEVARSLWGKARDIRIVNLSGLPDKGDVCDWLDAGHGVDELKTLIKATPAWAPSSVPTPDRPVGTTFLEVGGEELARSTNTLKDLAYLEFLGNPGFVVRGWSHLLSGAPRVGKTDLEMANVRRWLDQGLCVLFITEEPRSIWEPRLGGLPGDWTRLRVVFGLGADPDALRRRARDGQEEIVVVDALRNLLQLKDETDNSEIARAVNPWIADARTTGKTLRMTHHNRKGGGDYGEAVAGGHAFLGSFDIVVEILRDPNQAINRRLLRTHARLIESREAIYEKIDGHFRLLGDPRALQRDEVQQRALPLLTVDWQTTDEILTLLDDPKPSKEQLRLALVDAAKAGKAERDPDITLEARSTRGKSHRWRLPIYEREANLDQEVEFQRSVL